MSTTTIMIISTQASGVRSCNTTQGADHFLATCPFFAFRFPPFKRGSRVLHRLSGIPETANSPARHRVLGAPKDENGERYSGMRNSTPASASARLNSARTQGSSWAYGILPLTFLQVGIIRDDVVSRLPLYPPVAAAGRCEPSPFHTSVDSRPSTT